MQFAWEIYIGESSTGFRAARKSGTFSSDVNLPERERRGNTQNSFAYQFERDLSLNFATF